MLENYVVTLTEKLKDNLFLFRFIEGMKYFIPKEILDDKYNEYQIEILFSGGFDSTFVLLCLCELKKLGLINQKIYLYSIEGPETKSKNAKEKQCRENIVNKIRKDFNFKESDFVYNEKVFSCKLYGDIIKQGYNLQHLYIHFAIMMLHEKSLLFLGYNESEGGIAYKFPYLQNMADSINAFYEHSKTYLVVPLKSISKVFIIENMIKHFPGYFELCSTCENPSITMINEDSKETEIKPCLKCVKCHELMDALHVINYKKSSYTKCEYDDLINEVSHKMTIENINN